MGRRDRCRRDVTSTGCSQRSGRLNECGTGGQHIIDQQNGCAVNAGQPSALHPYRLLKVFGALPMVEPGLVGHPTPQPQRRSEPELTFGTTNPANGRTRQQIEGRVAASPDGSGRRRDGDNKDCPVAGCEDGSKAW